MHIFSITGFIKVYWGSIWVSSEFIGVHWGKRCAPGWNIIWFWVDIFPFEIEISSKLTRQLSSTFQSASEI